MITRTKRQDARTYYYEVTADKREMVVVVVVGVGVAVAAIAQDLSACHEAALYVRIIIIIYRIRAATLRYTTAIVHA